MMDTNKIVFYKSCPVCKGSDDNCTQCKGDKCIFNFVVSNIDDEVFKEVKKELMRLISISWRKRYDNNN